MLHKTNAIVLRSVKYGETSIVATLFTALFGLQTYMVKGVRSAKKGSGQAGMFQPGSLLELVVYHNPQRNIQRISQYQAAYLYKYLPEDIVKSSILLFSCEVLLRLLPENAPQNSLFEWAFEYLVGLDSMQPGTVANFPVWFVIRCGQESGFTIRGNYSEHTPWLDQLEGAFTEMPQGKGREGLSEDDTRSLDQLLSAPDSTAVSAIQLNAMTRLRLLDWYIAFLQHHTEHMGAIKSLAVLRVILH